MIHRSIVSRGLALTLSFSALSAVGGTQPATAADFQPPTTERVSVSSTGAQATGSQTLLSGSPDISSEGRYVAFQSAATNLVPGDTNAKTDVFVHDRSLKTTTRVSISSAGEQQNAGSSWPPAISGEGRYVAFVSDATNLIAGDTNGTRDVFVHDTDTATTTRVSVGPSGAQASSWSQDPSISADGRFVTFESGASNLVPADSNATEDVFVHDRSSGVTTRMSISSSGGQANSASTNAAISPNGRYVAFESAATNLVPADANGVWDTFVHDRVTGTTVRVSVSSSGEEANFEAAFFTDSMTVSNHGDVVWPSYATNLVPGPDGFVIHLFLHDLDAGTTELVSVSSSGALSEGD